LPFCPYKPNSRSWIAKTLVNPNYQIATYLPMKKFIDRSNVHGIRLRCHNWAQTWRSNLFSPVLIFHALIKKYFISMIIINIYLFFILLELTIWIFKLAHLRARWGIENNWWNIESQRGASEGFSVIGEY
jgi:hypothetical protein